MKTEVDLAQLAAAVSAAILQFAQPQPAIVEEEDVAVEPIITKKKRGRPKKKVEEVVYEEEATEFKIAHKEKDFSIQHNDGDRRAAKRVPFKKKIRVNQFQDDMTLAANAIYNEKGQKIKYPEHTAPRPKQEKYEYQCDICNRKFEAFPSYIPPKGEGGHQPQIRCYNCNTK